MQQSNWNKIEQIFNQAVNLPADEKRRFVVESCGSDTELCRQIYALLSEDGKSNSLLEVPLFSVGVKLLDEEFEKLMQQSDFSSYYLHKLLGRGGMGAVFLAEDSRLERFVALKVLPPQLPAHDESVLRFQQEARAASSISHPNVAHIYEFGNYEGRYFLAMEYIPGKTLRELLNENKIDLPKAVDITIQIAKALSAAHKAGIVHRDIKPENIMITDDGLVKVLDFGLAKLGEPIKFGGNGYLRTRSSGRSPLETMPGIIIGTTAYMSPEQVRGQNLDTKTDLWSLGVCLYEMLTGSRPFCGNTKSDVQAEILLSPIPQLPEIDGAANQLNEIVQKTLKKDLCERYQSADEIIADLQSVQVQVKRLSFESIHQSNDEWENAADFSNSEQKKQNQISGRLQTSESSFFRKPFLTGTIGILFAALLAGGYLFEFQGSKQSEARKNVAVRQALRITNSGKAVRAALSPKGEKIAYALEEVGQQGLFVRLADAGNNPANEPLAIIAPSANWQFTGITFTPDEQFIYYGVKEGDVAFPTLYRIPAAGGVPEKILTNVENSICFSPDGKQFVFLRISRDGSSESLYVADSGGGNERLLYTRKMPDFIPHPARPAWSPDGQTIICAGGTYKDNRQEVVPMMIRVNDGIAKPIFDEPWEEIWQMDWLSDGSGFVMTGRKDKTYDNKQLWRVAYPSGEVTRLTDDYNDYFTVSIARNPAESGNRLTTLVLHRNAQLWKASLLHPEENATRLASEGNDSLGISWAKDQKIVYGSMRSGTPDVWTMSEDGTNLRQLTFDPHADFYPIAASDNRYIVFVSERSGVKSLWRMKTDGSEQILLAQGASSESVTLSPDGNTVYYHSYFGGAAALWRVSIEGGNPEKIISENLESPAISPDGRFLAAVYRPENSDDYLLTVRAINNPTVNQDFIKPLTGARLPGPLRWSPDGKSIVYVVTKKGVSNLWAHPLDGSQPKQITNFNTDRIFSFDWSPDGKQVICSRGEVSGYVTLLSL